MKTKNYINYKKKYLIDAYGEKNAPFNVNTYIDYPDGVHEKLASLAKRNSGSLVNSGYDFMEFEFFTEKGVRQFVKKARGRYGVSVDVFKAIAIMDVEYEDYKV